MQTNPAVEQNKK